MATQEAAAPKRRGRITAAERARIIELIEAGDHGCAEIARQVGRAKATVSEIASAEGLTFDRARTKAATEARQADVADRLSQLTSDLLDDAQRLRAQMWEPAKVWNFNKDGDYTEVVHPEPTFADKRNIAVSAAVLVDKVLAIRKTEQGPSEAAGLIVALVESIRTEHATS